MFKVVYLPLISWCLGQPDQKRSYLTHHVVPGLPGQCVHGPVVRVFKQGRECVYLLMVVMEALWPGELVVFILVHNQQYHGEMNSVPSITILYTMENTNYERFWEKKSHLTTRILPLKKKLLQ